MIERGVVGRLTAVAIGLCAVAAGAAAAIGGAKAAGGVGVGLFLGLVPFLSWTFVVGSLDGSLRRKVLAVVLLAAKLGIYGAVLYFTVTRELVSPPAVLGGMTLTVFTFGIGALAAGRPAEARA